MTKRPPRVHIAPGLIARLAEAYLSREEMARVLNVTVGVLGDRMKKHAVRSRGEEVRREREHLQAGRTVIREPWGDGKWVWNTPALSWTGPKMQPAYMEAMLEHGSIVRVETVGNVEREFYRYAKADNLDGNGQ